MQQSQTLSIEPASSEIPVRETAIRAMTGQNNYCDLCGKITEHSVVYERPDIAGRRTFTKRCDVCRFVHLDPIPDAATIRSFYDEEAPFGHVSENPADYAHVVADKLTFIDWMLTVAGGMPATPSFLDVGAGIGTLVHAMSLRGFDSMGIDFQIDAAAVGARLFGAKIVQTSLDDLAGQKFGAIALCDCIEHLSSPTDDLRTIKQMLHSDGILFGNAPNFNNLERYLVGTKAEVCAFPLHLSFFTPKTLRAMLEKSGFEVLFVGFVPPYTASLTVGLRKKIRLARDKSSSVGFKNLCDRLIASLIWTKRYLCYPAINRFVMRTGLLGRSTVFVARPRR